MSRLLSHRSKRNLRALRLLIFLLACSLSMVAPLQPSSVQAQSCEQGGSPLCWACNLWFNIVFDPHFEQTSCSSWEFGWQAERAFGTALGATSHFGRFNGPSVWRAIRQTTTAKSVGSGYGDGFDFSYTVEINDPMNDPLTRLDVWIIEPNGNAYLVDRITGAHADQYRSFDLGDHPSWMGQTLQVQFFAYQPGNSTISIDGIGLWQGP
jgi:hypothetical protein